MRKAASAHLCRQAIAGRYPFARGSNRDVALADFTRLFASGGLMDSFFQKNLASQVDVRDGRWAFRRDASGKMIADNHLLSAFQNAETIRNVFFAAGAATPSIQIELTPLDLDPAITQYALNIDGQTMRYAHGPPLPMAVKWPGGAGRRPRQPANQHAKRFRRLAGPRSVGPLSTIRQGAHHAGRRARKLYRHL